MKPLNAERAKHPTSAPSPTSPLTPPTSFFTTRKHTAVNTLLTHGRWGSGHWRHLSPCLHTHTHKHHTRINEHLHVLGCWFLNWRFNRRLIQAHKHTQHFNPLTTILTCFSNTWKLGNVFWLITSTNWQPVLFIWSCMLWEARAWNTVVLFSSAQLHSFTPWPFSLCSLFLFSFF